MAFMATGVPIANGLSGLIAAAVFSSLEGKYGIAGWQWLFIVLAICGGVFAFMAALILPDYPASRSGSTMWTMVCYPSTLSAGIASIKLLGVL